MSKPRVCRAKSRAAPGASEPVWTNSDPRTARHQAEKLGWCKSIAPPMWREKSSSKTSALRNGDCWIGRSTRMRCAVAEFILADRRGKSALPRSDRRCGKGGGDRQEHAARAQHGGAPCGNHLDLGS